MSKHIDTQIYEVYNLLRISYRHGTEDTITNKYFSSKEKAELEFYDIISSFSNPQNEFKIKKLAPLNIRIIESGDKWSYEISIVKDIIKIW